MKKNLLFLIYLFCFQYFTAQEMQWSGIFEFEENKPQKIFIDNTRLRAKPSLKSEIIDSLKTNQEVVILKKDATVLQIGERSTNWYLVSVTQNNKQTKGYIWGGNLCIGYKKKGNLEFLLGIPKTTNYVNFASIKTLENNVLDNETFFETNSNDALNSVEFVLEDNKKLKNIDFTIRATISGDACSLPTTDQYFLVISKKLVPLPQLSSVAEASLFYYTEKYIFPNEKNGIANTIIKKIKNIEVDEKTNKEKTKKSQIVYSWDGQNLNKSSTTTKKPIKIR